MQKMRAVFFFTFFIVAWASLARPAPPLPQDQGAAGFSLQLRKLQTIASAMHTTAHPDDEHGGTLTMLSRGQGARLALLTLNRGEAGANALGAESFEALGLIRTEELLVADRYYGVDSQYFTTVIDGGFSKRLDEALAKWGHEHVLRDVVAIIRMYRPLVLISRFQGNQRDGHGHHQIAGLITQEAFKAAADPTKFPEQLAAGLRPWQALKLYTGGARADEDWNLRIDTGQYDPVLGDAYHTFARIGLSFQRSQNSGRMTGQPGPSLAYYKRLVSLVDAPVQEQSFFDGIDTRVSGMYRVLRHQAPPEAKALLEAIEKEVHSAVQAFSIGEPSASVPALIRGLQATRAALHQLGADFEVAFMLQIKEQQFMEAINAGLGMHFTALAQPQGVPELLGPVAAVASVPTMGPVVPDQTFEVHASLTNRSPVPAVLHEMRLLAQPGWSIQGGIDGASPMPSNQPVRAQFVVTVPANAPVTRPYYRRDSIVAARYTIEDPEQTYRPAAAPVLSARARYEVAGVPIELREIVRRREASPPYGHRDLELAVVPALALKATPANLVVPLSKAAKVVHIQVELQNNRDGDTAGTLQLQLAAGWTTQPPVHQFQFARAGEKRHFDFTVAIPSLTERGDTIEAIASIAGHEFREGYDVITQRDLETRYLYHPAQSQVRGVDVTVAPGLQVGYIMGVGDEVPAGIAQLGATVHMLGEQDLAKGDLRQFDVIMTGPRAYAVREDLKTYNQRLLDYVHEGGNLIVLYNTHEFVPAKYAPFPADLPARAEEVSEEDSPVEILAPDHRVLQSPNKITQADFDGWVEQRGSKFFRTWDSAYTPMIATHDQGQAPQQGGWLLAQYGQGYYTYFAYALHRQLPYGVAGAYRLLANLLSLGK